MAGSVLESTQGAALTGYERIEERYLLLASLVLFAVSILVELAGFELGLVRPVVVVPFLSLVPGYLALRTMDVSIRDGTTGFLYALGLSLVLLMFYGWVANTVLPIMGVEAVFREVPLFASLLVALGGLFGLYWVRAEPRTIHPNRYVEQLWNPVPLGLLCVPLLAVLGARVVTRFGDNRLILFVLALLAVIAVAGYLGYLPENTLPLAVWVIAVSLLLHNSVLTHVLAWDAPKELRLATLVIENGVWQADVGGKWMKNAMLRIVLLHPIYALLSDIDLLWEFKTVNPILFSFAPVAFYRSYQVLVSKREAIIAALLSVSLFSFFTVLSWNSRTNGALLFLSLIALLVTDRALERKKQRVLFGCFMFGLLVSHYATAFIALAAMPGVIVGNLVLFGRREAQKVARTTIVVAVFFLVLTMVWYTYVMYQSKGIERLAKFSIGFFTDIYIDLFGQTQQELVSSEDSVTTKYATTRYTSTTINLLQPLNILIGLLAGLGLAGLLLRRLVDRLPIDLIPEVDVQVNEQNIARTEYLLYAAAFLGVFGLTFIGVSKLNTARTLMPALLFFAPIVVLTVRHLFDLLSDVSDREAVKQAGKIAVVTIVVTYFALNSGLYGSTAEQEYHPNILIDKGQVVEDGNLAQKKYFWSMYVSSAQDLGATNWISRHADVPPESRSATGGIQKRWLESSEPRFRHLRSRQVISGMYACEDVNREPVVRQGTCQDEPGFPHEQMSKPYVNSGSVVYVNLSDARQSPT